MSLGEKIKEYRKKEKHDSKRTCEFNRCKT